MPVRETGMLRGDLGLGEYAHGQLQVLYLMYLRRVHNALRRDHVDQERTSLPHALPDLDDLATRDAHDNIAQRYIGVAVDNGGRVLFMQRRSDDEFHPGRWEVPVAHITVNEHPMHAIHRALTEATGLEIDEITDYLGHFDFIDRDGHRARQHTYAVSVTNVTQLSIGRKYGDHRWELADGTTAVVEESVAALVGNQLDTQPRREIESGATPQ
jgi:8-oxo-dGTP diphosphatase